MHCWARRRSLPCRSAQPTRSRCSRPATAAYPGFYIGAEGGLNWLLSNGSYSTDTGYAVGGKIGYDFVGPRIELEGLYRNNRGSGTVQFPNGNFGFANGQINQISAMANVLYDFAPGATITPYIGAGAGIAFVDPSLSHGLHHVQHAVRLSGHHRRRLQHGPRLGVSTSTAATTARAIPASTPTTTSP